MAQALGDDNSSLVGNFADEVGRRQYFGHKPDPLARQQAHLLDLAAGVPVRRDTDETPDRHLPAGDPRLSDDRLVATGPVLRSRSAQAARMIGLFGATLAAQRRLEHRQLGAENGRSNLRTVKLAVPLSIPLGPRIMNVSTI